MSVTLKLDDKDAALVAGILLDVSKIQKARMAGQETVNHIKSLDRRISSSEVLRIVDNLAGAFETAVRANQR